MNPLNFISTKDFEIKSELTCESVLKKIRDKTAVGDEYIDLQKPYQKYIYQGTFTGNKIVLNDFQSPGSGPAVYLEILKYQEYTLIKGTFDGKRYMEMQFFILIMITALIVIMNLLDTEINIKNSFITIVFFALFTIILQNASTRKAAKKCREQLEKILKP